MTVALHVAPAFSIRLPRGSDQAYVASTWVRSAEQPSVTVDRLLDDPRTRLLVAVAAAHDDTILGWLAYAPMKAARLVHYAYVRKDERRRGIARSLMLVAGLADERPLWFTCRGPDADALLAACPRAVHVPVEAYLE